MLTPSTNQVKDVFQRKGYAFFDTGAYNLNIYGIRSKNSQSDKFDDTGGVIYLDRQGVQRHFYFPITTDPGKHWLLNPLNIGGTALAVPGQYRGVYVIGIHGRSWRSGGYEALEQVRNMRYVRDNNRNSQLDFSLYNDPKNIFEANLKTNFHRAHKSSILRSIGRYSAGCQVAQNPEDFDFLLKLCHRQVRNGFGSRFTYTLLEEKDFGIVS